MVTFANLGSVRLPSLNIVGLRVRKIRCSMYPSIFNSFPVIRTASAKKSPFSRTAAHIFVSPGDAPAIITQYVAWKDNSMLAKPLAACTYLYSIVSELYTMLKSMRKSKNRYFYHIFVSPGDAPGAITLNVVWMESEFDAYKLPR